MASWSRAAEIGLGEFYLGLFDYLLLFVHHLFLVLQYDLFGALELGGHLLLQNCFFGIAEDVAELAG